MSNYNLMRGQNPRTLLPIRYVPPIYSESIVPQINEESQSIDIDSGMTHLSNQGLLDDPYGVYGDNRVTYDLTFNDTIDRGTVYDCRFTGYCDEEWRTYEEDGRVKYWYKDVDAVKLPQYIERHDLDNAKAMANQHFANMMVVQRESLQRDWLSKRASDRYQQKLFPMHTLGRKMG